LGFLFAYNSLVLSIAPARLLWAWKATDLNSDPVHVKAKQRNSYGRSSKGSEGKLDPWFVTVRLHSMPQPAAATLQLQVLQKLYN